MIYTIKGKKYRVRDEAFDILFQIACVLLFSSTIAFAVGCFFESMIVGIFYFLFQLIAITVIEIITWVFKKIIIYKKSML